MPLLGHIGSAWPGEGCVALGALPELGPRSKRNHYLAARALWDEGLPDGQGKPGTGRTLALFFGSGTSCSSLLHPYPPPLPKNLAAMSPSQHSGCLGKQILATLKYPRDRVLCDGRQLPWKPPSNKKKKEKTTKFKAALVAQRNCRPCYGFWHPPFFFYLFQLKGPKDKAINLSIPRGVREGGHGAGN